MDTGCPIGRVRLVGPARDRGGRVVLALAFVPRRQIDEGHTHVLATASEAEPVDRENARDIVFLWPTQIFGHLVVDRGRAMGGRAGRKLDKGYDCSLRSEEHTSELQSLMRISYAAFCLKKKKPII